MTKKLMQEYYRAHLYEEIGPPPTFFVTKPTDKQSRSNLFLARINSWS